MKKALIEYMKNHFSWDYSHNYSEYTFFVDDLTSRALRIEPFIKKYFNSQWEILANTLYIECSYYDYDMHWVRRQLMNNRDLKLIQANGIYQAEFIKYISGRTTRVKRLLTQKEALYAQQLIDKNDLYGIDNFCYSIS